MSGYAVCPRRLTVQGAGPQVLGWAELRASFWCRLALASNHAASVCPVQNRLVIDFMETKKDFWILRSLQPVQTPCKKSRARAEQSQHPLVSCCFECGSHLQRQHFQHVTLTGRLMHYGVCIRAPVGDVFVYGGFEPTCACTRPILRVPRVVLSSLGSGWAPIFRRSTRSLDRN